MKNNLTKRKLELDCLYMVRTVSNGILTVGRLFNRLLMCVRISITFFLVSSLGESIFKRTGPRNLFTVISSCSSVSAHPNFKRTRSNKTKKKLEYQN